jgi:very-short-patch-repair endonuclease
MDQTRLRARQLRRNPTEVERLLWQRLQFWQVAGFKFRRQQALGDYIADFICFERRLIVEIDGGQHADLGIYDAKRDAWLRDQGFIVLRFWNSDVLQNMDGVLQVIGENLRSTPLLSPSPQGEGSAQTNLAVNHLLEFPNGTHFQSHRS